MNALRSHPTRELAGGLVAVPAVATDLTTADTFLMQLRVCNPTAGPITLTIRDKQGTPRTHTPTITVSANSVYIDVAPALVKMIGGVNWQASAVGLEAEVFGFIGH